MCAFELSRLAAGVARRDPLVVVAVTWSVALVLAALYPLPVSIAGLVLVAPLLVSLLFLLLPEPGRRSFSQWSWAMAGALYIGVFLGHWGSLYRLSDGLVLVVFGMLVTFSYDSFAYFAGRAFGRHKLAPHLSAAKTWEGVGGGLAMAIVAGLVLSALLSHTAGGFPFSLPVAALAAIAVSVAAQVGDLIESGMKRSAGVKDAGGMLPGHGGMLDRFDSLLLTGPVLYYLSLWVIA